MLVIDVSNKDDEGSGCDDEDEGDDESGSEL